MSSYHVRYAFQSESTLYRCLNVKELLAWSRREIWSLSDCSWTRTHSHLVHKRTLNHLAKWLNVCLWTKWLWVRAQLQSLVSYTAFLKRQNLIFTIETASIWFVSCFRRNFFTSKISNLLFPLEVKGWGNWILIHPIHISMIPFFNPIQDRGQKVFF